MDVVWKRTAGEKRPSTTLSDHDLLKEAFVAFLKNWEENGGPAAIENEQMYKKYPSARTPDTAMEMLAHYIAERRPFLSGSDVKLIAIERPFAVPLDPADPSLYYVGRLDKVFNYKGRIYIGEHKTTTLYSKNGPFQDRFTESFSPNSQIDGYLYAAHMLYGDALKAVWVDAALVHRDVHDAFRFLPVERQFAQLDGWLWEARQWIANIEANLDAAENLGSQQAYTTAFPKNTSACNHYDGCAYVDLCKMWANPHARETPDGFSIQHWSPFEELELEQLNLRKAGH